MRNLPVAEAVRRIADCHGKWQAAAAEPRLPFIFFLRLHDAPAAAALGSDLDTFRLLPKPIQRTLRPPRGKRVGPKLIERYSLEAIRLFRKEGEGRTLADFLEELAAECATEGELRQRFGL
jgi:hypothetical protein